MKQSFEGHYSALFGARWEPLRAALLSDAVHARMDFGGAPYFLDPASLCAALCLPLSGKTHVADLCAAPGGKSLVTAMGMPPEALLDANERSPARKNRLVSVLDASLPPEVRARVSVTCSDAAPWCRTRTECYDAILLDAPCSSERHVLADPKYLGQWSPSRIKSLSMEQWALLSCAWRLLSPGGHLLYATCALSFEENDGVLSRLAKKFPDARFLSFSEIQRTYSERLCGMRRFLSFPDSRMENLPGLAERTRSGFHLLPDTALGSGPIYFAVMEKIIL